MEDGPTFVQTFHPHPPTQKGKFWLPHFWLQDKHATPTRRAGFEQSTSTSQGNPKQEIQVMIQV